jgi:ABC-type Fe3+-hydroxamate transport system substrate-binding protein
VATVTDDLGFPMSFDAPCQRVVSLVPSLTESVALTEANALAGATDWCTHPAGLSVQRVRGTKNPNVAMIIELKPDVVLANKEENRRKDVEALRAAGVPVWVTQVESVPQAITSLERMFVQALGWPVPAWLDEVRGAWPAALPRVTHRGAVVIWREPWMVVGAATFTGDLVRHLGVENVFGAASSRYPKVEVDDVLKQRPDVVLLPDEPYPFAPGDGPEAFPTVPTCLLSGRLLTWYGPSLRTARAELLASISEAVRWPGRRRPAAKPR